MALDRPPPALPPIVLRAVPGADHVLTPEALAFIADLQGRFGLRLHALMVARGRRQERIDRGELPDYLPQTKEIRQGIWRAVLGLLQNIFPTSMVGNMELRVEALQRVGSGF